MRKNLAGGRGQKGLKFLLSTRPQDALFMNDPELIKAGATVGMALVEKTTFYDDAIKPAAQQVGKSLETIGKAVNVLLSPLSATVWGYEKIRDFVVEKVSQKLDGIEPENLQTPKASVAVPIIEGLRNVSESPDLQELYANLLASSMVKETAIGVLPAFGEIIKQLTSDEAKILSYLAASGSYPFVELYGRNLELRAFKTIVKLFSDISFKSGTEYPAYVSVYLENLSRLALIEIHHDRFLSDKSRYNEIQNSPYLEPFKKKIEDDPKLKIEFENGFICLSTFGSAFCRACGILKVSGS